MNTINKSAKLDEEIKPARRPENYRSSEDDRERRRPSSRSSVHSSYDYYDSDRYYQEKSSRSRASDREDYYSRHRRNDDRTRPRSTGIDYYDGDSDDNYYNDHYYRYTSSRRHLNNYPNSYDYNNMWWDYYSQWFVAKFGRMPTAQQFYSWILQNYGSQGAVAMGIQLPSQYLQTSNTAAHAVYLKQLLGVASAEQRDSASRSAKHLTQESERSFDPMNEDSSMIIGPSKLKEPKKYLAAHSICRFSSTNGLVIVSKDEKTGRFSNMVELRSMKYYIHDQKTAEMIDELESFPGPLIRVETHKNSVILFCQRKSLESRNNSSLSDSLSVVLIWKLLELLLRQNGSVMGTDLAALLNENAGESSRKIFKSFDELTVTTSEVQREPLNSKQRHYFDRRYSSEYNDQIDDGGEDLHHDDSHQETMYNSSEQSYNCGTQTTDRAQEWFRQLCMSGNKKEALEHAMKFGLWGHALFLARNMDKRIETTVFTRFANSLAVNDPLQTLFQLMTQMQPSAVTKVPDEHWGDWKPHLAMILANYVPGNAVDIGSIVAMGNTLLSVDRVHAAHFCYLCAYALSYCDVFTQNGDRNIILIGIDNRTAPLKVSNEAVQCTEIFEYAMSLLTGQSWCLPSIQLYKFIYVLRLVEHGFKEEAYKYCAHMAKCILQMPALFSLNLSERIYQLGEQLQFCDPQQSGHGTLNQWSTPQWLVAMRDVLKAGFNNNAACASEIPATIAAQASAFDLRDSHHSMTSSPTNLLPSHAFSAQSNTAAANCASVSAEIGAKDVNQTMAATHAYVQRDHSFYSSSMLQSQEEEELLSVDSSQLAMPPECDLSASYPSAGAGYYAAQMSRSRSTSVGSEATLPPPPLSPTRAAAIAAATQSNFAFNVSSGGGEGGSLLKSDDYYDRMVTPKAMQMPSVTAAQSIHLSQTPDAFYKTPAVGNTPFLPVSSAGSSESVFNSRNSFNETPTAKHSATAQQQNKPNQVKNPQQGWLTRTVRGTVMGWINKSEGYNEMILPDDKDPTIKWDEDRKCWVNTSGEEENLVPAIPPPTDMQLMQMTPDVSVATSTPLDDGSAQMISAGAATSANVVGPPKKYNLPRNKGSRYVDVFGGNAASGNAQNNSATAPSIVQPHYFIPAPIAAGAQADVDDFSPFTTHSDAPPVGPQRRQSIAAQSVDEDRIIWSRESTMHC